MFTKLPWQDNAVIILYLGGMLALGFWLSRQRSDEDYFLAGRKMPWFVVGLSVIASIRSSLTYLSEPGEAWKSGVTHLTGTMIAVPFEMLFVWLVCIPFLKLATVLTPTSDENLTLAAQYGVTDVVGNDPGPGRDEKVEAFWLKGLACS